MLLMFRNNFFSETSGKKILDNNSKFIKADF